MNDPDTERRRAEAEWLLGMVPPDGTPRGRPMGQVSPDLELREYLRAVWRATLDYLRQKEYVESLVRRLREEMAYGRATQRAAVLGRELGDARREAAQRMDALRAAIKDVPARPVEGAFETAKTYFVMRAMDVQDSIRTVLELMRVLRTPSAIEVVPAAQPPPPIPGVVKPRPVPERPVTQTPPFGPLETTSLVMPYGAATATRPPALPFLPGVYLTGRPAAPAPLLAAATRRAGG